MRRLLLGCVVLLAFLALGWHARAPRAMSARSTPAEAAFRETLPAPLPAPMAPAAQVAALNAPGLGGTASAQGVRWGAQDGSWDVSWGWAHIEGLRSAPVEVRGEDGRWVASHGAIEEVFEKRANGVEYLLRIAERPPALAVRIAVDADVRAWSFDGQPRVTLSRPRQGDLLEVRGLEVRDATGRRLAAALTQEPSTILITAEDHDAIYPVTIDPLITPPAWTADPMEQSWTAFGTAVAGAGDFNRDGYADVLVGSARGSYERVFLFLGSAQGPSATPAWTLTRPLDGAEGNPGFGSKLADAGDVNGDGYADIVVGDPSAFVSGGNNGRVMLYLGGATGPTSAPAWTATGAANAWFGAALATAGDVNRDGKADLLVGADGGAIVAGVAKIFLGTTTGLAPTAAWFVSAGTYESRFGASVASAGDVNGDGFVDVIVGAPNFTAEASREGRAYLYLGTSAGVATTPAWTADPTNWTNAAFGTCVAGAGDMNGDGFADVLVGAPYASANGGRVYLYLGSASGLAAAPAWTAEVAGSMQFGAGVASPGDLNGDGRRDVVVSAPLDGAVSGGTVYAFLNSASGLSNVPSLVLSPTGQSDARFGGAMAPAGDTNGDGRPDLVIGAPNWSSSALSGEGRAYVYFGTTTRTAVPWLVAPANDARAGTPGATLDWMDAVGTNGAASYDVEVDDTSDFAPPLRWSATVAVSQTTTAALPEGGYYWHVRTRDTLGTSEWSATRRVYVDGQGPSAPAPSSPLPDAWTTPTPQLAWDASTDISGVASYDVEVSRTSDFSAVEWSTTATYTSATSPALVAGRHWWRVRARDTWGWLSAWSVITFQVDDAPPTTPLLLSPADGAALSVGNPVLDWTDSTDANGIRYYVVYVDNEPTFANPLLWAATVPTSQVEVGNFSGTQFYWRVLAVDAAGNGTWSAAQGFTRSGSLPSTPSTISPGNGVGLASGTVALDWTDATDPDGVQGYEVQVSMEQSFATPAWSASTSISSATTAPLPEGKFWWRARAIDVLGNVGLWSSAPWFVVDATPPTAPAPISPADGAVFTASAVTLDWSDATDAVSSVTYELEVDTEPTFALPQAWAISTGASYAYRSDFPDGFYYWRVRARDLSGNRSAYSAVWTFTIDAASPPAPTLVAPAAGAMVTTSTPTLDWTDVADPSGVTYEVSIDDESAFSAPLVASATGLAASQWTAASLGDCGLRYWRARAIDGRGHVGAWSATSSFAIDRGRGFYVGLGAGAAGQIAACRDEAGGFGWRPVYTLADAAYNAASGETRPASGDLDGDGVPELVVGRGRYTASGGWFAILDDTGTGFSVVRWVQIPFSAYNAANGETTPACGDIDGDGRDEIVIGLGTYTTQGGYFALYDDASTGYAFIGWRQVPWSQYNAANGETRPAVGDVTGDGKAEVFVGLGRYPSRGGRVARFTSGSVAFSAWNQFSYTAYNSANGETWPACGDVDADGRDELCVGMGAYPAGGGYVEYIDDSVARYASLGLKRVPWTQYNSALGETRPSVGAVMGGAGDETVVGLGPWAASAGWVAVLDRAPGYGLRAWKRAPATFSNAASGATKPSVRR